MAPNPHLNSQGASSGRDPELLVVLQDLSRRLDINSAANVGAVRAKIQELIDSGKIEPPTLSLSSATFGSELRALTRQGALDVRASSLHSLSASQIMQLLGRDPKCLETPVEASSLSVPELSLIISDAIRRYCGFVSPRQTTKRHDPKAGQ